MRFHPLALQQGEVSPTKTTQVPKREDATLRRTTKKKCRTWSCCRWYRRSYTQDLRERWRAAEHATYHTPLGHDSTQVSVRFGTATPRIQQLVSKSFAAPHFELQVATLPGLPRQIFRAHPLPPCSVKYRFQFYLACLDQSRSLHRVVNVRLHGVPALPVLCPFSVSDRCSRPASPCDWPPQSALVPMSTSLTSLHILWVGSVPLQLRRGT